MCDAYAEYVVRSIIAHQEGCCQNDVLARNYMSEKNITIPSEKNFSWKNWLKKIFRIKS